MDRASGVKAREAGWIAKLVFWLVKKRVGSVPKAKKLAAYDTPTLLASTWMDAICGSAKTVPGLIKELVQVKVAMLVGCPFWRPTNIRITIRLRPSGRSIWKS